MDVLSCAIAQLSRYVLSGLAESKTISVPREPELDLQSDVVARRFPRDTFRMLI